MNTLVFIFQAYVIASSAIFSVVAITLVSIYYLLPQSSRPLFVLSLRHGMNSLNQALALLVRLLLR